MADQDRSFDAAPVRDPGRDFGHGRDRGERIESEATVFWYTIDDLITVVPSTLSPNGQRYANDGDSQEGWGIELGASWALSSVVAFRGNYAYQSTIGNAAADNSNRRFSPKHQIFAELNWRFAPQWQVNLNLTSVHDRQRATSDLRPDPDDYTLVGVTVRRKALFDKIDLSITANNLFDEDAVDASSSANTVPGDLPLKGRNVYAQITLRF